MTDMEYVRHRSRVAMKLSIVRARARLGHTLLSGVSVMVISVVALAFVEWFHR
jgi:hypothetical protein